MDIDMIQLNKLVGKSTFLYNGLYLYLEPFDDPYFDWKRPCFGGLLKPQNTSLEPESFKGQLGVPLTVYP